MTINFEEINSGDYEKIFGETDNDEEKIIKDQEARIKDQEARIKELEEQLKKFERKRRR